VRMFAKCNWDQDSRPRVVASALSELGPDVGLHCFSGGGLGRFRLVDVLTGVRRSLTANVHHTNRYEAALWHDPGPESILAVLGPSYLYLSWYLSMLTQEHSTGNSGWPRQRIILHSDTSDITLQTDINRAPATLRCDPIVQI